MNPFIIAISSVRGGGKTEIATRVKKLLKNSYLLSVSESQIETPEKFLALCKRIKEDGQDEIFDLKELDSNLEELLLMEPEFVILDVPFCKKKAYNEYIDYKIFIDTPFDVAIARYIVRDCENIDCHEMVETLDYFLREGRKETLIAIENYKKNSNLIVDGCKTIREVTEEIEMRLKQDNKV